MKSKIIMVSLLALIVASGLFVIINNNQYNNELHTIELVNGKCSNEDISVKLAPRGYDNGDIASWTYEAYITDDNVLNTIGTIYELSVTNNTNNVVSDWEFEAYMSEPMYLNGGWNGVFDIHQNVKSGQSCVFATQDFNLSESSLKYSNNHDCLLIPLYQGDYFAYTPSESFLEVPIGESDLKNNELTTKTIGFILYCEKEDRSYITDFENVILRYHMHKNLFRSKSFLGVLTAFILWFFGVLEMIILKYQSKKFLRQRTRSMKIIEESMSTFANFIDAKDPNTRGHSVRVAHYTRMAAEKMGMSEEECTDIYYIALLHDCGKISIPQEILTKPGKLTDEEYDIMKSHALKGYEMLENFTSLPNIGMGAYCHHERYDGKGYPQGLKGEDIPLIGRIICVADALDAMNSKRCYRDKLPAEVIINELKKNKGIQFDPEITDYFLELIDKGDITL